MRRGPRPVGPLGLSNFFVGTFIVGWISSYTFYSDSSFGLSTSNWNEVEQMLNLLSSLSAELYQNVII